MWGFSQYRRLKPAALLELGARRFITLSCGDLKSLKIGARRLVTVEALREWLLKQEVGR